jgi:modulator of FtsH protease HflK
MAHEHNDKCSHDHHHHISKEDQQMSQVEFVQDMDSGSKALAEALRVSFIILKLIMIVLVILFFASGIFTVEKNEKALVLRFGKVLSDGGGTMLLEPGLHWSFPYPIDEIVKIPVSGTQKLEIDSFWYFDPSQGRGRVPQSLNPIQDSYALTRNESIEGVDSLDSNDYNIVHCKWQLNYTIEEDPYAFFKNVNVRTVRPGEVYSDVIAESIEPLLKSVCDNAVISTLVKYSIDEATTTAKSRISLDVRKKVQRSLSKLDTGIMVKDMQILVMTWPRQVDNAFQASIKASQTRKKIETDAWSYYDTVLTEAAGPYAEDIYEGIMNPDTPQEEMELLWDTLAGESRRTIADARAYKTTLVENARANADYLERILPEYKKRPELVLQKIYQDTMEQVLDNADEKILVQPSNGERGREFRVIINRDPKNKEAAQDKER